MTRPLYLLLTTGALLGTATAKDIDFARDIQPILNANCTECHGGVKAAGGVSFVYEDMVINHEGDSGYPVVKPGDLKESELFYRITTDDEDDRMPPTGDHAPLKADEIALIEEWIEQGAKWSAHWAFIPPVNPEIPESKWTDQALGPVDELLFARLEQEGLQPSPLEEPGRLLRRLSIALTGLPPTLEESRKFEADYAKAPKQTVEKTVDALMARPAFGERWASMWLDLVRYADSGGLGQDQRRTIWAYRDWVVQAFHKDMPFDEFTIKQLAGDLLPQPTIADLVATAAQRNTQTNNEGGTDDEQFRVEAVVDRVNTAWQMWGSITFSCVQCHDHPYDPIRHDEYYQFMDFYNNSADSDLSNDAPLLKVPNDPANYEEAATLRREVLALKEKIWKAGIAQREATDWNPTKSLEASSNKSTEYAVANSPERAIFHTVGTVETGTHTHIHAPAGNFGKEAVTGLQLHVLPYDPETAVHSPEWGFLVAKLEAWVVPAEGEKVPVKFRWSVPDVPWMPSDPMRRIGADGSNWGADSRIHHARRLVLIPEEPLILPEGSHLALHIHCNKNGHGSHPMAIDRGYLDWTNDPNWTDFQPPSLQELVTAEKKLNAIPGTTVPVMAERPPGIARPTHVFAGGNSMEKTDLVTEGLPASLTDVAPAEKTANRLDMAHWWVSDNHPLTARVFVNRLWEQLFGVGIVPTLEDFGSSGERPTHPELLDYLALRFQQDHAWSTRAILKEMVLTHAFQQVSRVTPEQLEKDPANRFLARGPRLRLSAEAIRDQALAVSGLLSPKVGGPPVHPPIPPGVWQPFQGGDKWSTPEVGQEDRYRRSIYTYVKRSIPYPTFAAFDAPSREFCTPRRLISNTPLQALTTLNDPAFVECAEALGQRLQTEFKGSHAERLTAGYRLVTGREPSAAQLDQLLTLLKSTSGEAEPTWTVVAQVLLNLDESLTY